MTGNNFPFSFVRIQASMPEADRHDTSAIYKKITLPQLQRDVPQLNWKEYLQATLGNQIVLQDNEPVVSYAMPYLIQMGRIFAESDRRVIHNYIIWRLVMSIMTHMIDDYQRVSLNAIAIVNQLQVLTALCVERKG